MRRAWIAMLPLAACTSAAEPVDCPSTSVDVDGVCRVRCDSSAQCLSGEVCDPATHACRRGAGANPLRLEPSALELGELDVGARLSRGVSLFNDGPTVGDLALRYQGDPQVTLLDPPPTPFTLDGGLARAFQLEVLAARAGELNGTLTVTGCAGACRAEVALHGVVRAAGSLSCQPASVDFGDLAPDARPVVEVSCRNDGAAPQVVEQLVGTTDVAVVSGDPGPVAPGDALTVGLTPTGARLGPFEDAVRLVLRSGATVEIPVAGRLIGGGLTCEPTAVSLGVARAGEEASAEIKCTNLTRGPLTWVSADLVPPVAGMQVTANRREGQVLAAGEDVVFAVAWRSLGEAEVRTTLRVSTSGEPTEIPISGNVPACVLSLPNAGPFRFGVNPAGAPHTAAIAVRNVGLRPCTISTRLGGGSAGEVRVTSAPSVLAAGVLGYVDVQYTPQSANLGARLTIEAREDNAQVRIDLEGTRGAPALFVRRPEIAWGSVPAGCAEGPARNLDLVNLSGNAVSLGVVALEPATADFVIPPVNMAALGPGERLRLRARAQSAHEGPARARLRVVAGGLVQYVELSAEATATLTTVQAPASLEPVGAIDVLFVLDGDAGSARLAERVGADAQAFMSGMSNLDVNVGVLQLVGLTNTARSSLVGTPAVLTPSTPGAAALLEARLSYVGLPTSAGAGLLGTAADAVEGRRATNANAGFLRPHGQLEVVVVTARDDTSNDTVSALLGALSDRTIGRPHALRVSTISGGLTGCSGNDGGPASSAPRLERAVFLTGGLSLSACPRDGGHADNLAQLAALMATAPRAGLPLASEATPGTLAISGGSAPLAFSYDRQHVAVVFDGSEQPQAGMVVSWTPWCVSPSCGDGRLDPLEACDRSGTGAFGCTTTCHVAACGDGETQGAELCDDGNLDDEDGCTRLCFPPPG